MLLKVLAYRMTVLVKSTLKPRFIQPYWVEITTQQPSCIYYFGFFDSRAEAQEMRHGCIEDSIEEKAIDISVNIKRCMPAKLTITDKERLS